MLDPLGVPDVVRDADRLVADVAFGDGVSVVAADGGDPSLDDVDPDAAVVAAEHADGRQIGRVARDRRTGDGRIDGGLDGGLAGGHGRASLAARGRFPNPGPGRAIMARAAT